MAARQSQPADLFFYLPCEQRTDDGDKVQRGCSADDGGDRERVREGVRILEGEDAAIDEGLAVVDDAIIVTQALEDAGVDKAG
ncbi:hypothetical protein RJ639_010196 [Escallonia herrerae]|uniref:Uncharacterized protein n=1 Tax=Escallonia herrerae TaxID=1293975 RepID=A0AA88VTX2_9ASTE|nr:hypothetical protein RJ639_010196 [Escallonia herrerae]